ncbi:hypothetical protein [Bacillus sp. ISTL8]|uniref:hypothetical protein n=1 Tax=Bacillus sp. ISTL8 TaxID=2596896 RepID=UPI0014572257|nr:hypothetical protein [Bacillus sp. ISTL8]
MEQNNLLEQLDSLIENASTWIEDAERRADWNDVFHYQGKKEAFENVKKIILKQY